MSYPHQDQLYLNVFADIKRVNGDMKSEPMSVASFVLGSQTTMDREKEVIITPTGDEPGRNDFICWKIHKMYVEIVWVWTQPPTHHKLGG